MTSIPRRYDNRRRRAGAAATEQRVIDAAGACFGEAGYGATTIAAVAAQAGVSVETIKKTIGTKPRLLRRWFDQQVAGPEAVAPTEAAWVRRPTDEPDVQRRIEMAADAVAVIMERTAMAVAERGSLSNRLISPKKSLSDKIERMISRPSSERMVTLTRPEMIMNIESPRSCSKKITASLGNFLRTATAMRLWMSASSKPENKGTCRKRSAVIIRE